MDLAIEGGFGDSVLGAQSVFRALMDALSRPGVPQTLGKLVVPPAPLSADLGAVALTMCDHDATLWLDPVLAISPAVSAWLQFHAGVPLVTDPAAAQFALVSDPALLPPLASFAQGTDEYPDRSTTIVVAGSGELRQYRLVGPGIKDHLVTELALPGGDFLAQWAENRARFPRGIDLLLVGDGRVTGLPRTTRISEV
jgi:alpha-D-ribose 1-methylphosphonate 5-triphosphate synthase subunit PhnH